MRLCAKPAATQQSGLSRARCIHVIVPVRACIRQSSVRVLYYVVNHMRRSSLILLSTALLLGCGHAAASAVESQQISTDASNGCPETTAAANDRGEPGDADPSTATVAPVRRTEKSKTVASPRASTRAAAPRWHSFLPGMIR